MAALPRTIGSRPASNPAPDLTLDVALSLGIMLLAGVLVMWRIPPIDYPSWADDVNGLRTASLSLH